MRFAVTVCASAIALFGALSPAMAAVSEPNGLAVPASYGDFTPLPQVFSDRGEAVDYQKDAQTSPALFSPGCGFSGTLVSNGTNCKTMDFGWYNQGQGDQIYSLVPVGSALGKTFTAADVRSDARYKGGLIGFAIRKTQDCGETHYSEQALNGACVPPTCATASHWITALIYKSTKTANAYYVAFEDGETTSNSFGNDGDFNDYVYFITGITCEGGGEACDTGKPGICASGATECVPGMGTQCKQLVQPQAETCDALDNDCNGTVDDGNLCPDGQVCFHGSCVAACNRGEFACVPGLNCSSDGYCVDPLCDGVKCDAGKACRDGQCVAPCDGVVCPAPAVCQGGLCVDPCKNVTCSGAQVCDQGVCVEPCSCLGCRAGLTCGAAGKCVYASCALVTCPIGQACANGSCLDACIGAVCPKGQTCSSGACQDSSTGGTGNTNQTDAGVLNFGGGDGVGGSAAGGQAAGAGASPPRRNQAAATQSPGCACAMSTDDNTCGAALVTGLLSMCALISARRRRWSFLTTDGLKRSLG